MPDLAGTTHTEYSTNKDRIYVIASCPYEIHSTFKTCIIIIIIVGINIVFHILMITSLADTNSFYSTC